MKKRTLNRRDFLRLSATAATGAIVAACAPATPQIVEVEKEVPVEKEIVKTVEVEKVMKETVVVEKEVVVTPKPAERVALRFAEGSWVGPEGIKFWTDDIAGRFELENPGIKLEFESAEAEEWEQKVFAQMVAGDAPDVMFLWGEFSYNVIQKGQALRVDDYFDEAYLEDFYPNMVLAYRYEGGLYGVPKYVSSVALGYNKDMLDEAGVDYPDGTWDWDDFLFAAQATTKREASGDVTQWGDYVDYYYLAHWVWQNGGEWMDTPTLGTKCLLNEQKAMEALKFNHDMIWGPSPVSPTIGSIPDVGWWNVFSTGKIALMESHSWCVTNYMRENDFQWDFADLPTGRDGTKAGLTFANGYVIYKGTKHPEESIKLVEFLTSPWAERAGARSIVGLQPARRSVVEEWDLYSIGAQGGYDVAAFTRNMEYARLRPYFKDIAKTEEIFMPIWDQIWVTGEMGLEEGVNLIVQRVNEYLGTA